MFESIRDLSVVRFAAKKRVVELFNFCGSTTMQSNTINDAFIHMEWDVEHGKLIYPNDCS